MEVWQLGGVGGDEAGGDAAPVAAADDGHPVLVSVPVHHHHLRRPECSTDSKKQKKEAEELARQQDGQTEICFPAISREYIENLGGESEGAEQKSQERIFIWKW